jgi:hypothetical protein
MSRVWRVPVAATVLAATLSLAPTVWSDVASYAATQLAPGSPPSAITYAPVRPTHCTADQIAAVDLDNCALMIEGSPAAHGFPTPPFPGDGFTITPITPEEWVPLALGSSGPIVTLLQNKLIVNDNDVVVDGKFGTVTDAAVRKAQETLQLPVTGIVDATMAAALDLLVKAELGIFPGTGWSWNGNSWSGSPALATWEQSFVKGTVKANPLAAGVFEGFLADIRRGNYRVDEAGTYAFRCTATTVRNCKGLTPSQLSYHAWGLAVDVNYSTNPLQTVYHPSDACSAPVKQAMPDWVLKAAQHWGLFWGGWYSCPKAGRKSVVKDPHHFEFRGSPELAAAIIAKNTAENATPIATPGLADLLLSCGDRGPAVAEIRSLLPESYRPVEAASLTNTFTTALAAALTRWQTDHELPPTGAFDTTTAAAFGVTVTHTEVFPVLHRNSCGASVSRLQTALGITVTGGFGTGTMNSLRTWQRAHGLAPTGVTDTATAAALELRLETPDTTPDPTTVPSDSTPPTPIQVAVPLTVGARGGTVRALQRALTTAGFPVSATGIFGPITKGALRAFLAANHLPVSSTLSIAAATLLGLAPVPKLPVRYRQRGENVKLVQQALRHLGANVRVDGRFGRTTRTAVRAFQRANGLLVTGVVDTATAHKLGW